MPSQTIVLVDPASHLCVGVRLFSSVIFLAKDAPPYYGGTTNHSTYLVLINPHSTILNFEAIRLPWAFCKRSAAKLLKSLSFEVSCCVSRAKMADLTCQTFCSFVVGAEFKMTEKS